MKAGTQWTEREDQIIRTTYPTEGVDGAHRLLKSAGFDRTRGAVKTRAGALGAKRIGRTPTEGQWTDAEIAILMKEYPPKGTDATVQALAKHGYNRSAQSVRSRANILGVQCTVKRRGSGEYVQCNFLLDKELDKEIIEKLEKVGNRSAYIRSLIEADTH